MTGDEGGTIVLKVTSGPAAGETYELERDLLIGREEAHINLADPELSRHHATLHRTARGVVIEDLGSLNGTFVNGERVTEPMLITDTAAIRVGKTELRLEFPAEAADRPYTPAVAAEAQVTRVRGSADAPDTSVARTPPREVEGTAERSLRPEAAAAAAAAPEPEPGAARPRRRPGKRALLSAAAVAVAVIVGVVVAVVLVTRGGASSHQLDIRGVVAVLEQVGQLSAPGSSQVEAAQVSGPPGGDGAAIQHVTIGPGGTIDGTAQLFFPKGSITLHYFGQAKPVGGGSFRLLAKAKVIASSGSFKGASGTVNVIAVNHPGNPTSSFHALGKITY